MALEKILETVFGHIEDSLLDLWPAFYPNVGTSNEDEESPTDENHLRVFILPARTIPVGVASTNQVSGLIQISVYCKQGQGAVLPAAQADLIITELFPRFSNIGNTGIRIDEQGWTAPPIMDGAWYVTPVTIPFNYIIE